MTILRLALAGALACGIASAQAAATGVKITEWQYNGSEFVEFTNFGATAVDFTGWSFNDFSTGDTATSLSGFGSVASGESVIMSELSAADFRALWSLSSSVKVVGGNTNNLGRDDAIHLYDSNHQLVDSLVYNDAALGGPRTQNVSGRPIDALALGANDPTRWALASVNDVEQSYTSITGGFVGSPGVTQFSVAAPVPEPETYAMLLTGLALIASIVRKRRA